MSSIYILTYTQHLWIDFNDSDYLEGICDTTKMNLKKKKVYKPNNDNSIVMWYKLSIPPLFDFLFFLWILKTRVRSFVSYYTITYHFYVYWWLNLCFPTYFYSEFFFLIFSRLCWWDRMECKTWKILL